MDLENQVDALARATRSSSPSSTPYAAASPRARPLPPANKLPVLTRPSASRWSSGAGAADVPRIDRAVADVDASPAEVYAAFVDADALGCVAPAGRHDRRAVRRDLGVGGGFTMTLRYAEAPDGGGKTTDDTDVSRVAIDDVVASERVVWASSSTPTTPTPPAG